MFINNILLLLLKICHIIILLCVLIIPFTNIPILLFLHILFSLLLLLHWYGSSDVCFLTYLESLITGNNINDGFIYKIISPFYNISKIKTKQLIWTITILLLFISLHKFILFINNYCKESIINLKKIIIEKKLNEYDYKCINNMYNI